MKIMERHFEQELEQLCTNTLYDGNTFGTAPVAETLTLDKLEHSIAVAKCSIYGHDVRSNYGSIMPPVCQRCGTMDIVA